MPRYVIGLDYGTNSVRALVVRVDDGAELASAVWNYAHGENGIVLSDDPNLARQHPADYVDGARNSIREALAMAEGADPQFRRDYVIGIGVDTTGSTPLPVDRDGRPLALKKEFADEPAAMAWLWKDHTSTQEAAEITDLARKMRPAMIARCGGAYSSEWFFSKILHCRRTSPKVFRASYSWVEIADWIPAMLTGTERPEDITVGVCAAGHKAMYADEWGGYPDAEFLGALDPALAELRARLRPQASTADRAVGGLTEQWASDTGLPAGLPVAVGAFDAHLGAVGAGIRPGTLVKIIGTSTCDIMVAGGDGDLETIPGVCGMVRGSVLPGCWGIEAGQSAVGDIFNWFVNVIRPGGQAGTHEALSNQAAALEPGSSGLLALDWNNGNRSLLVDQKLTGLLLGQTLHTTAAEIYRALIEATAFGSLMIINRLQACGAKVERVVNCGGIAEKSPLVMQIYADVTGRDMYVSRSAQTCALGAAVAAAVVAGPEAGGYASFADAQAAMTGLKDRVYRPDPEAHSVYRQLFSLYGQLHDALGTSGWEGRLYNVMKDLIDIRNRVRQLT
jgi:L-ribulokinase